MEPLPSFQQEPVLVTGPQESHYFGNDFGRDILPESKVAYLRAIFHDRRPSSYIGTYSREIIGKEKKVFLTSLQKSHALESFGRLIMSKAQYTPDIRRDTPLIPIFSTLLEQSPQARKEVFSALTLWVQRLVLALTQMKDRNANETISDIKQRLVCNSNSIDQLSSAPTKTSLDTLIYQTCERQEWNLELERYIKIKFIEANGEIAYVKDPDILCLQAHFILARRVLGGIASDIQKQSK